MISTTSVVFAMMKGGSSYIHLVHSVAQFGGDLFSPAEYQNKFIGLVGDRIMGVNPNAIIIKDELWNWSTAKVVNNIVKLTTYFDNLAKKVIMYLTKQGDSTADVKTPVLLLIPAGLAKWLLIVQRSPWDLHKKIMEVINDA